MILVTFKIKMRRLFCYFFILDTSLGKPILDIISCLHTVEDEIMVLIISSNTLFSNHLNTVFCLINA